MYSVLAPLLPALEREFSLSKAQAGLLVSMFAVGMVVAALPVGLFASSVGVKRSMVISLVVLAAMSVGFGLAQNFGELLAVRFAQGAADALCWSCALAWLVEMAPRARRSEMIAILSGAGAAGAMVGPAVGAIAVAVGRDAAFAGVACFALILAFLSSRFVGPASAERPTVRSIGQAHASRAILGMQTLVAVPGLLLGALLVLAPLQLSRLGWGAGGIAGTYLVAAFVGVIARPFVGRWADRYGRLRVIRLLLLGSIPVTVLIPWLTAPRILTVFVVCAVSGYGAIWGPAMALLSQAYEEARISQVAGFAFMNVSAGGGIIVGSAAGGVIADIAGDATTYTLAAAICLATAVALPVLLRRSLPVPAYRRRHGSAAAESEVTRG
jgi:MFS family permease